MAHVMLFYLKSRVVCCQEAAIERSIDYDCQGVVVRVGLPLSLSVCVCVCACLSPWKDRIVEGVHQAVA